MSEQMCDIVSETNSQTDQQIDSTQGQRDSELYKIQTWYTDIGD